MAVKCESGACLQGCRYIVGAGMRRSDAPIITIWYASILLLTYLPAFLGGYIGRSDYQHFYHIRI